MEKVDSKDSGLSPEETRLIELKTELLGKIPIRNYLDREYIRIQQERAKIYNYTDILEKEIDTLYQGQMILK